VLLIIAQPDFGTALIFCAMWLAMTLLANARWWMVAGVVLGVVLLFGAGWGTGLIGQRSRQRVMDRLSFIGADPGGSGYHQRQAQIAIGAGGFFGKGYMNGTQAQRGFLPEQQTDFIFSVIAEEFGFLGCIVVLALYLFILLRLLKLAEEAETPFGRLVVTGIAALLAMQVFINVAMNLKVGPVAGVPLPFISYGGSNLLTCLLALGVALNISRHRRIAKRYVEPEALVRL
jgi:rod shape determining protein RodA